MPSIKTDITEIVTGLGMLGSPDLATGLSTRPAELINVTSSRWDLLQTAQEAGTFAGLFKASWENGGVFLNDAFGLRGRKPLRIEWKGPHRTPGYELIPVDLRVDHVFLISCKYDSRVLFNASPSHLFARSLAVRHAPDRTDWYAVAAPDAYQHFYGIVAGQFPNEGLPEGLSDLTRTHRERIGQLTRQHWPPALEEAYRGFSKDVAVASAAQWNSILTTESSREEMLWRMLRISSAPYFMLGTAKGSPLRLRVQTPWDWKREYRLRKFDVFPAADAGQPLVHWRADIDRLLVGGAVTVAGHVEIRWSHGRFCGNPEAKIYLDTSHSDVPGYVSM